MHIEKMNIEGGFLDGTEIDLSNGLNVLIGGRGTGKTSVIELLRYCFSVPAYSEDINIASERHANHVLGDGRVTVTLSGRDGNKTIISRSNTESAPQSTGNFISPIIFSQKEIESVGLTSKGRRALIDKFIEFLEIDLTKHISDIRHKTKNITKIVQEIDNLELSASGIPEINKQISELEKDLEKLNQNPEELNTRKKQSDRLIEKSSSINNQIKGLEELNESLIDWEDSFDTACLEMPEFSDYSLGEKQSKAYKKKLDELGIHINKGRELTQSLLEDIQKEIKSLTEEKVKHDEESRILRKSIEDIQKGAGKIIRNIDDLKQQRNAKKSIPQVIEKRKQKLEFLKSERDLALDKLDQDRETTVSLRKSTIKELNAKLNPHIDISMTIDAIKDEYFSTLLEAFKGSGLRYKEIVDLIVEKISPREFATIVESFEVEQLQEIIGINKERAFKIISAIRENGWEDILTCKLEDEIEFKFLDGEDYKPFAELSTGQRCTVVLPIILEQSNEILILDQPEDHLDNAYIADTLVKALADKVNKTDQLIIATHNANIPVLGNASNIIHLKSDGIKAYVEHSGTLDERKSVEAITKVMEGGIEAFKFRDEFYARHYN